MSRRSAISKISEALKEAGSYLPKNGLAAYHAGIGFRNANLRVGSDRRIRAAKKAVAQFRVRVTVDVRGELELRSMNNADVLFSFSEHKYGVRA